jgi:ABC-type Fe3+/spermidine/putrescine transport system ATPase subunit
MTGIFIDALEKKYGYVTAVGGIDLRIDTGKLVVLLGPSGCGKTTTLRCIAGLEEVSGGTISMGDTVVSSATHSLPPESRSIGMVFQSYAVWPHMNVAENIAYGVKLQKLSKEETRARVAYALEVVGLTPYAKRSASELSGGQQQRVALARAIALQPRALLFDEPLSNLDAKLRQRMRMEIRNLQRRLGITAVYVTHDQEEAMVVADLIVLMKDGGIEQIGTPEDIYYRPRTIFAAEFIGSANILPGCSLGTDGVRTVSDLVLRPSCGLPSTGSNINVVIRPENLRISEGSSAPAGSSLIKGKVVDSVFLGAISEVTVALGDDVTLRAHISPARRFEPGTEVRLTVAPENIVVLGASGGPDQRAQPTPADSGAKS